MKKLVSYKTMKILVVAIIILYSIANAEKHLEQSPNKFSSVDANEIPKILNMISDRVQDNYKRIKTWEGKVESELNYIHEGKAAEKIFKSSTHGIGETPRAVIKSAETIVEFSLDAEKDCIFVHNYSSGPIKYMDLDTGRDLGAKGIPGEAVSILTKEYYIKSQADRMRDGVVTSRKAIKKNLEDCPGCQTPPVFDPRESFSAGEPVWKKLQHILKEINKNGKWKIDKYELKVEEHKVGDVIQYRITMPGKIAEDYIVFNTMAFSGDKSLNITLFEVTDANARIFQNATWDYELVDGIYLPKETTFQSYAGKDGGLSYSKKMSFKNSRINHSIPAETFTYRNLGLKNDDKFIDKIEGKEYRYKDANLVFVTDVNKM